MKRYIIIVLVSYSIILYAGTCVQEHMSKINGYYNMSPHAMIEEGRSLLKEGDLVVRLNRDPSSRFIKYFNHHDKSYSHSGIVLFDHGYPYVYHIIDGEENPDGKLRIDSLNRFCNSRKNIAYGIFRYEMSGAEIRKLKNVMNKYYAKGIQFDEAFNFTSDDKMYCSEMVSKALKDATGKRISIEPTQLSTIEAGFLSAYTHLPFSYTSKLKVISIDDLYANSFCHLVKRYTFN